MLLRLLLLVSLLGCDSDPDPGVDAGSQDSAAELDSTGDSTPSDANPGDTTLSDTVGMDAPGADSALPDVGAGNYVAVAGARCTPQTRIGAFSLQGSVGGRYLYGTLNDSPRPFIGEPQETAGACSFYQANRAPCDCPGEQVCTHDRAGCVAPPARVDIGVVIHAGAESHTATVMNDGSGPVVSEDIPLTGDTFGMTVTGLGATITVAPTGFPSFISVEQDLMGTYDAPESMDLTWTPGAADTTVYSLTNINHHRSEPTFTECAASATDGAIFIPGSMLVPLSVSTGLEFQQVQSIRFAAAELPEGCVEFAFAIQ